MLSFDEILAARHRLAPYLSPTPLRTYESLDHAVGSGVRVFVKHENHLPTKIPQEGLAGFVTVSDTAIADALRLYLRCTHNLCEGAGATGLAGLRTVTTELAGQRVGLVMTGGNIDQATLAAVLAGRI